MNTRTPTTRSRIVFLLMFLGVGLLVVVPARAQDKEAALRPIRETLLRATRAIRRKDTEEATKLLDQVGTELEAWKAKFNVNDDDSTWSALNELVTEKRESLSAVGEKTDKPAMRANRSSKVSFSRHVLPILEKNCFSCHDAQAAGGLRLDTLEGMRQGGKGGRILEPKNPAQSLIMNRVMSTNDTTRMPKDADPLERNALVTLNDWILQGALIDEFKLNAENAPENKPGDKLEVARPTGGETVSFKKDIAPFFAGLCLNCHNDQQKRGGLSMASFEKLLQGGESGEVLIPGDFEHSRLFRLTGGLENPRMPNSDARITRKNYDDLKKWIEEGIKYDGGDPAAPLTSLLPTEKELAEQRFASMPEAEVRKLRMEESLDMWKRVTNRGEPVVLETEHFLVIGNVSVSRLQQAATWAEETRKYLAERFGDAQQGTWKGRLALFVTADPFLHTEFLRYLEKGEGEGILGIVEVAPADSRAFVEVLDSGDPPNGAQPGFMLTLKQRVAAAYLRRGGIVFPTWFERGISQLLVRDEKAIDERQHPYYEAMGRRLQAAIPDMIKRRRKAGDFLNEGFFQPSEIDLFGYGLVRTLAEKLDRKQLDAVVAAVRGGTELNAALTEAGVTRIHGLEQAMIAQFD